MKKINIILLVLIISSCQSKTDETKQKLEKIGSLYLNSQALPGEKIDSIILIKYDTLHSKTENEYLWYQNQKQSQLIEDKGAEIKDRYQIKEQLYNLQPTPELKQEMDETEAEFNKLKAQAVYYDSIMKVQLTSNASQNDFKGYRAWYRIKGTKANGVQQNFDSLEVTITPDYKIREFEDEVKKAVIF
jgi:hypothetical protein